MAGGQPGVVHFIVPHNIDEPTHPSGGNHYDRRLSDELSAAGWLVREHAAPGSWPWADRAAMRRAFRVLASIPDRSTVLVDGLIASNAPEVFMPAAGRLHLVVLLHTSLVEMSLPADVAVASRREFAVLSAARGVVTTSRWARERLLDRHSVAARAVTVAEPGVDAADLAVHSSDGARFLCVAAVAPHKGQAVVIDALAEVTDREWSCRFIGALDKRYAEQLGHRATATGVAGRIEFCGPLDRKSVDDAYRSADLLLHAWWYEAYGMVVTEALAHGVPVVAARVGGVGEALGLAPSGRRPGILVPPGDSIALAVAIRAWLEDAELRTTLRAAACERRNTLAPWSATASQVARALLAAADGLGVPA